ncbi:hypothetical protein QF046_000804 [Microbacterium sp. W4I4]|nr:hypothetical protein [Microbacterium sp. W4I4]
MSLTLLPAVDLGAGMAENDARGGLSTCLDPTGIG